VICFQTIIVAILLLLHAVNVHSLWIYELLPNNQCGVDRQRRDFEAVVWPWISAVVNVYLPLVLSTMLSILLAARPHPAFSNSATTTAVSHFDVPSPLPDLLQIIPKDNVQICEYILAISASEVLLL